MEETQKYLNSIPSINQGGCGIAALAIDRKHKKKGFFAMLFSLFSKDAHIVVLDGDNIIDSTGKRHYSESGFPMIEKISEKQLVEKIRNGTWDQSFDRSNIGKIEKDLGVDLSDIK